MGEQPAEHTGVAAAAPGETASAVSSGTFYSWERLEYLGRGGQAKVYKVRTEFGALLAAKYSDILPTLASTGDAAATADLPPEVKLLCQLRHRNIVTFVSARTDPATQSLVIFTELIEGRTLHQVIDGKPMDEGRIRLYSVQLVEAMHYLHSHRPPILHRDINCNNAMIESDDTLKLIDFGLSTSLPSAEGSMEKSTTSSQNTLGTVGFLAPEILHREERTGLSQYSTQSDIWAFGCTVYQMATGHAPYKTSFGGEIYIYSVVRRGAPSLPKSCSDELRRFYSCCVAKDRRLRTPAGDLLQHNFLLYRPEELRELRRITQDYQKQRAELARLHEQQQRQTNERHKREVAAANSDLLDKQQQLMKALKAAEKVVHIQADKRRREVKQRARERERQLVSRGATSTIAEKAARAEREAEEARTAEQLAAELETARQKNLELLLQAELRHYAALDELEIKQAKERKEAQLQLDTSMSMLKQKEATALFDQELHRHRQDTESQRAAQLRAHALERRQRRKQLEADHATRARQFRQSLQVREPGLDAADAELRTAEFSDSASEQERVRIGMERLEAHLAKEVRNFNRQVARTEAAMRGELRERLAKISARAADKRKRLELEWNRQLAALKEVGRVRRDEAELARKRGDGFHDLNTSGD